MRVLVDDARRSKLVRHRFEKETGLSPLAVTAKDAEEQTAKGYIMSAQRRIFAQIHLFDFRDQPFAVGDVELGRGKPPRNQ